MQCIELFENGNELLRIAQPPDQHPAEVGPAYQRDDAKLLGQQPARAAKVAPADKEACQDVG